MIVDKIFNFLPDIQKIWEYPKSLNRKLWKEDRLTISRNIHEMFNNMFIFWWWMISLKNFLEKKPDFLTSSTYNFPPSLEMIACLPNCKVEWWKIIKDEDKNSVFFDKNVYELYMKSYWPRQIFLDWINRMFYEVDNSKLWEFSSREDYSFDEVEILTYLFWLKVVLLANSTKWSVWWREVKLFDQSFSWLWDIVIPNSQCWQFFSKYNWNVVVNTTVFNINWNVISKWLFNFLDKYQVDYSVVSEFISWMLDKIYLQKALERTWKYVCKNELKTHWNMLFLYYIYTTLSLENDWMLKEAINLFRDKTDTLSWLYDELEKSIDEYKNIIQTTDYKMFMLAFETTILYTFAYLLRNEKIAPTLSLRWILYSIKWYKFFNYWLYELLKKLDWDDKNIKLFKSFWTKLQSDMLESDYNRLFMKDIKIKVEAETWKFQDRNWNIQESILSPIAWYTVDFLVYSQDQFDLKNKKLNQKESEYLEKDQKWEDSNTRLQNEINKMLFDDEEETQKEKIIDEDDNVQMLRWNWWTWLNRNVTSQMIYEELRKYIVWQDWILKIISKKLYSYLVLKSHNSRPLSLFLVWPSWSWKSYLSSVLVKVLNNLFVQPWDNENKFTAQEELISKYNTKETISALLGSPTWYQWSTDKIPFFETLCESKNQIILFDEMEKWTAEMYKFFLDFMNNWKMESISKKYWILMTDSEFELKNEKIHRLNNVIFIFASNAIKSEKEASELWWWKYIKSKTIQEYEDNFTENNHLLYQALLNYRQQNWWVIDPAFIDRLDSIYLFNALTLENKLNVLEKKFLKELWNYNITEEWRQKIINRFRKDFWKWWKWLENLKYQESMRWFDRYINEWISSTLESMINK